MLEYLLVIAVVFGVNVVPAFAPPTWIVLVYFSIAQDLNPVALVVIGVLSAASGRYILASYFRKFRNKFPKSYVRNMENAGSHLTKSSAHLSALFALFFISPLSSAQLFEAAGIMKNLALKPITLAFAVGRLGTYSIYVFGAHAAQQTNLGQILTKELATPKAIAIQVLMVIALVGLGLVQWEPHTENVETVL